MPWPYCSTASNFLANFLAASKAYTLRPMNNRDQYILDDENEVLNAEVNYKLDDELVLLQAWATIPAIRHYTHGYGSLKLANQHAPKMALFTKAAMGKAAYFVLFNKWHMWLARNITRKPLQHSNILRQLSYLAYVKLIMMPMLAWAVTDSKKALLLPDLKLLSIVTLITVPLAVITTGIAELVNFHKLVAMAGHYLLFLGILFLAIGHIHKWMYAPYTSLKGGKNMLMQREIIRAYCGNITGMYHHYLEAREECITAQNTNAPQNVIDELLSMTRTIYQVIAQEKATVEALIKEWEPEWEVLDRNNSYWGYISREHTKPLRVTLPMNVPAPPSLPNNAGDRIVSIFRSSDTQKL